jgi:hypothetical protein
MALTISPPSIRTRLTRRARARSRWGWARSERATLGLAAVALATAGTVVGGEFVRLWTRRARRAPGSEALIQTTPAAARDTVAVAVEAYSAAPRHETVLFNLLSGFLGAFALMRSTTFLIRRGTIGPWGNVRLGDRHIHHFVPGILLTCVSGATALVTQNERLEQRLAIPFGIGVGLTFDEAALLLDLRDVYWTRQGLLSVQVSLGLAAMLGGSILTLRMLRRGERRQEEAGVIPPPNPFLAPLA